MTVVDQPAPGRRRSGRRLPGDLEPAVAPVRRRAHRVGPGGPAGQRGGPDGGCPPWPPRPRPRACSTPCPPWCARWPRRCRPRPSAAWATCGARCCGARPCRPGPRASATRACSCARRRRGPTTSTRTGCWWRRCSSISDAARGGRAQQRARPRRPAAAGGPTQRQRGQPLRPAPVAGPRDPGASQRPGHQAHPLGQAPQVLPAGAGHARALRQPARRPRTCWALCDERTRAQHRVLVGLIERLERHGSTRLPAVPGRARGAVHRARCSTTTAAGWAIAPACRAS